MASGGGAALAVLRPGFLTSVQDLGRFGYQELGVPVAGALDRLGLRLANALVGNPAGMACLEISYLGPVLRIDADSVRLAVCGPARLGLSRQGDTPAGPPLPLETGRTYRLERGDVLTIGAVVGASVAYLAVAGGFALEPVMGSLSTYLRAGIGPLNGQPLREGTVLPLCRAAACDGPELALPAPPDYGQGPVRVVLGPQDDAFTERSVADFLSETYAVGQEADRMGLRLEGTRLVHRQGADIPSDGLVTGSIQVPGSGQPIILLADRQTAGGYAKIATVISADLPRVGRMVPGRSLRFQAVTVEQAETLRRSQEQAIAAWVGGIHPVRPAGGPDLEALYAANLVSGMVDALGDARETA